MLATSLERAREERMALAQSFAESRAADDECMRTLGRAKWLTRREEKTTANLRALENRLEHMHNQHAEQRVFQQSQADKIAFADKYQNALLEANRKMVRDSRLGAAINRMATCERNRRIFRHGHQEKARNRQRQSNWLAELNERNAGLKAAVLESHAAAAENLERIQAERLDSYCAEASRKTARFRDRTAELRQTQDKLLGEEQGRIQRVEQLTARCFHTNEELADKQRLSSETKDLLAQTQSWSHTSRTFASRQSMMEKSQYFGSQYEPMSA
jgi:hypothetical protein